MAKILISPLGVGGTFKKENNVDTHKREYQEACYKIDDEPYSKNRFMAAVLYKHLKLDGIIFIGTVKSMWEEVYRFFCEENKLIIDEQYWLDLASKIDRLNYESSLESLDLSPIREVLGDRSQCILIKYGLNQLELWENFDRIIQVVNSLKKGDEVYIDITHSFRSLSVFQFLTVIFINQLLTEKEINIAGVYYGMLDATRELHYTPVVDLKPLFEMTSWIKGAYSLESYGDGSLIAQLLKTQGEGQLASEIEQLSQAININSVTDIKQKSSTLKTSLQSSVTTGPFKYLRKTLEKFVNRFARSSSSESEYQLDLAGWYFDNKRYATGYVTLAEAIITYVCEIHSKDVRSKAVRDDMKYLLCQENNTTHLAKIYFEVNPIRNSIAHALLEQRGGATYLNAINKAKQYQQETKKIFKTRTLNS